MLRRVVGLLCVVLSVGLAYADDDASSFHAQMRTIPVDTAYGTRTTQTVAGTTVSDVSGRYVGVYTDLVRLSIYGKMTDTIAVQLEPSWRAPVKANPQFGSNISKQLANASLFTQQDFETAKVILKMSDDCTLSSGLMRAKLTWDYGDYMAEKTSLVESMFSATNNGVINDAGIEMKHKVRFSGYTLPVTVQILNGNAPYVDTNQNPAWLFRVEPTLGMVKTHVSMLFNQTSNLKSDFRYAFGAEYDKGPFYLRSEFVSGAQDKDLTNKNASSNAAAITYDTRKSNGYYVVGKYAVLPNVNLIGQLSYLEMNSLAGVAYGSSAREQDLDVAAGAEYKLDKDFAINATFIKSKYVRKDPDMVGATNIKEETLSFSRFVVGSRMSF